MIHEEINIKLERVEEEAYLDIEDVANHFWYTLYPLVRKYAGRKVAARRIVDGYFDLCIDDLEWSDNEITLIFSDAAGYCLFSHMIAHHWAELVLAVNQTRFKELFRSQGWEVKSGFSTVKEIKQRQRYFFFEHNKLFYAINRDDEGKPYLVCDQGDELEYEELTPARQKKYLALLDNRECQCPLCCSLEKGKLNPDRIIVRDLAKTERTSYSIKNSLKYHRFVEELFVNYDHDRPFEELGRFTKLKKLAISNASLKSIPDSIASLKGLVSLDISDNPIEELDEFVCNMTNLEELNLSGTKITRLPESFSKLTKLRELKLNQYIEFVPPSIKANISLAQFHYSDDEEEADFYDMEEALENCESALTLYLDGQDGDTLEGIERLTKLKQLELSNFTFDAIPDELFELTGLDSLELIDCKLSTISERVGELVNLQSFNYNNFEPNKGAIESLPASFAALQQLEALYLIGQPLKEFPQVISKLSKLRYLCLSESCFSSIPGELGQLSNLERLFISSNSISELPEQIGELPALTILDLRDNPIKVLPESICNIATLEVLELSGTEIEELPENLGRLKKLKKLTLPTELKSLPQSLKNCPELKLVTTENRLKELKGLVKKAGLKLKVTTK